jgi:hypothetical protein
VDAVLAALGDTGLAVALRGSRIAYPLVNAAHILGIALLVGSIATLDARVLGFARRVPLADAARLLLPVTITGLLLAVAAGAALFIVRPAAYADNPVFLVKLALIVLALANAAWLRLRTDWAVALGGGAVATSVTFSAALSLLLWVAVLVAGRLVAFFGY